MCHPALDFEKYIFLCFYTIRKSDGQESHIFDAAHCPERVREFLQHWARKGGVFRGI